MKEFLIHFLDLLKLKGIACLSFTLVLVLYQKLMPLSSVLDHSAGKSSVFTGTLF